ncbi:putative zinc metalloprotease chloroplastic isoform B [Chlorella sorokiniana]|uniref:Zinc metalloprotease chloroplastic isoform B n=1 Tax=Chlorella sorokiniana TaxID=3076 RepID=A0A2P6U546_CHLSO|nr:putative zinc metalloprotease chloroplastic isoform B [Chlorella sorokiniana]|eukprot:PRW61443.1 putative zinc metalloprotease chloroplastic isoform B [Chlorella sorokiniana]
MRAVRLAVGGCAAVGPLAQRRGGLMRQPRRPARQVAAQLGSSAPEGQQAAGSSAPPTSRPAEPEAPSIKQTMADLDALLGIEPEKEEQVPSSSGAAEGGAPKVSISADVLKTLAEAEVARAEQAGSSASAKEVQSKLADSIERIVEQAKKLAEEEGKGNTAGQEAVRRELENIIETVGQAANGVDAQDLKRMKEQVFGATTFWVTETRPLATQTLELGVVVKGNLRGKREAVFKEVCEKIAAMFGDKYVVRLVEDPEGALDESMRGSGDGSAPPEPRVQFEILPASSAQPAATKGWQRVAAGVLLLLTLGSTLQFGLAANIGLLPKETLQWLADPANLNTDLLPPGLETYDPLPFLSSTGNVFIVTLLPQLVHELAHVTVAGLRGIKIAPSYLIPNSQLGTFGSVTQLKSMVRDRTDLFDFSAAALVAGGLTSLALFVAGLAASHGGAAPEPGLLPVPAQLFQGSLLLGGIARLGLSSEALTHAQVFVSPLLVGGWCGLVTTALNCLPVGNLDGGRVMMSAFGRSSLAVSSLLSYVGLGLGLLGSSLALPFGLYVLICQRTAEQYIQDEVSGVSERRRLVAAAIIIFALLTLIPMAPDVVTDMGSVGSPGNFI